MLVIITQAHVQAVGTRWPVLADARPALLTVLALAVTWAAWQPDTLS